eukprot:CAMPEP_0177639322 /NCGR_PEP_ID=MMETSP0447-20121125/5958_1 /TAXON_ID=0 /ORGANISM="Stygamoeba regulata, Strain BSH-02190019" /LENGTH=319 /DNA_ID=CAMNT_0019141339 /DNA_START=900 /DNA_END=1858 /DNA_ORIENTATION=+
MSLNVEMMSWSAHTGLTSRGVKNMCCSTASADRSSFDAMSAATGSGTWLGGGAPSRVDECEEGAHVLDGVRRALPLRDAAEPAVVAGMDHRHRQALQSLRQAGREGVGAASRQVGAPVFDVFGAEIAAQLQPITVPKEQGIVTHSALELPDASDGVVNEIAVQKSVAQRVTRMMENECDALVSSGFRRFPRGDMKPKDFTLPDIVRVNSDGSVFFFLQSDLLGPWSSPLACAPAPSMPSASAASPTLLAILQSLSCSRPRSEESILDRGSLRSTLRCLRLLGLGEMMLTLPELDERECDRDFCLSLPPRCCLCLSACMS